MQVNRWVSRERDLIPIESLQLEIGQDRLIRVRLRFEDKCSCE